MYYGGPGGYPQPGARGPMGYPQQAGPGGMPRPRFYAPPGQMPGMPGMAPMGPGAPYGQIPPQQFGQYPIPGPPRAGGPRAGPPQGIPGQPMANGGAPRSGPPAPLNGVARPPQAGAPQAARPAGAAGARPAGYKLNTNARNAPGEEETNGSGLTAAVLANAAPQEQKQLLGEALYPKIHASQPDLAGKITGMLLEMDSSELLYLLESDEALSAKVRPILVP